MMYISVARYQYTQLRFVRDRARATVVATPTHCHWPGACGHGFKNTEVVCCDKLDLQLCLVCMTTSAVYIFIKHIKSTDDSFLQSKRPPANSIEEAYAWDRINVSASEAPT